MAGQQVEEQQALGDIIYRFYVPGRRATTCLIFGHGSMAASNRGTIGDNLRQELQGRFENVVLEYYSQHGNAATLSIKSALRNEKPIKDQVFLPNSPDYVIAKAVNTHNNFLYNWLKFHRRPNDIGYDYQMFRTLILEQMAAAEYQAAPESFPSNLASVFSGVQDIDIVIVRNQKKHGQTVHLSDILNIVLTDSPHYTVFKCMFCRGQGVEPSS